MLVVLCTYNERIVMKQTKVWTDAKTKQHELSPNTKLWTLVILALIVGWIFGNANNPTETVYKDREVTVEVEKVVERTPPACKEALNLDNFIFQIVGEGLAQYPAMGALNEATDYMERNTSRRTALYMECISR